MRLKITWFNCNDKGDSFTQIRELINHCKSGKKSQSFITMQSPIYEAIVNETYYIDLGYGKHHFTIAEIFKQ